MRCGCDLSLIGRMAYSMYAGGHEAKSAPQIAIPFMRPSEPTIDSGKAFQCTPTAQGEQTAGSRPPTACAPSSPRNCLDPMLQCFG